MADVYQAVSTGIFMKTVWNRLPKPFLVLAPMEDVTDTVFRRVIACCASPDVFFTEFTNVDALSSPGRDEAMKRFRYTEEERPIVAQIWGKDPDRFYEAARLVASLEFDGIDINFGCPERSVVRQGVCGAMIGSQEMVGKIIHAVQEGAGDLPVSVKTRLGIKTIQTEEWVSFLLSTGIDALTIHGRTVAEMSAVPARWDEIGKAVAIRDQMRVETVIIGNGDVKDRADAVEKAGKFGVDGIMIGRGIFENPWVFAQKSHVPAKDELLGLLEKHLALWGEIWGQTKNFATMKKFFKMYVRGFDGASELRVCLMATQSAAEVYTILCREKGWKKTVKCPIIHAL